MWMNFKTLTAALVLGAGLSLGATTALAGSACCVSKNSCGKSCCVDTCCGKECCNTGCCAKS